MLHVPTERNCSRAAWALSPSPATVAATTGPRRSASTLATSAWSAPAWAAATAVSTFRNPCCSNPVTGSVLRTAWCSPAVALKGTPARVVLAIAAASSASSG